jgi:hypothetical protein
MSDTHFLQPKILGYRQLSDEEAALINEVKALGQQFDDVVKRICHLHLQQLGTRGEITEEQRMQNVQRHLVANPARWLDVGHLDIQVGVMQIVRAIAQPTV